MKLRTFAKILGGLITLVILALLSAPLFLSSDALKAQLVAQVKKTTGRTLEIKGPTSIRLFPTIAVTAEDVSLSNPPGFNAPTFMTFKKLSTGAELKPLLQGELLINGIALDEAVINLEQNEAGAKNWEFTSQKIQEAADEVADAPQAQKQAASPIKRFALGDVTIRNSTVTYLKPGAKLFRVSGIDATVQGADANSPLAMEAQADYRGERLEVALGIAKTKEFLNGQPSPLQAMVEAPGASMNFVGNAQMGETPGAQGALNLSISSLPSIMEWATGTKVTGTLPKQITLKSDVEYRDAVLALAHSNVKVDGLSGEGGLTVDTKPAVPMLSGELVLGDVDLNALLSKSASHLQDADSSPAGAGEPSSGWSNAAIDLSGLKAVNAKLALAFSSLRSGKIEIGSSQLGIVLQNGQLNLTVKQMALYNGSATGLVKANAREVGADLALRGIDIEALMTALSGTSRLEGKTDLTLAVKAQGNSQDAWVRSLDGTGSLAVRDGALKGLNIGQFLRDAKTGFLQKSDAAATDFSTLNASFAVDNGTVRNDDLFMMSPALRVTGAGSTSLPSKTVNYRLVPTIAGTSKGQGGKEDVGGLAIPLFITGPWSAIKITPDVAGMVQEGIKDPQALKSNLKNIGETLKDYNSADDLKRALLGEKRSSEEMAPTTPPATEAAPDSEPAPLTKKQQREKAIQDGIGSLLKGL